MKRKLYPSSETLGRQRILSSCLLNPSNAFLMLNNLLQITYKWLSLTLEVSANVSKQYVTPRQPVFCLFFAEKASWFDTPCSQSFASRRMLWEFLQEHKDVSSVYFVSGWDKKKQRHVIALIKDTDVAGTLHMWYQIS